VDSSFWTVEEGTWSGALQSVLRFEVAVEYRSGDETVRVDNILLTGPLRACTVRARPPPSR
jgi:hypothetical protein